MKKIVSIFLVIVLAVTLCVSMGVTGFAEGSVKVTVSVTPTTLTGAGKVSVKATVTNETSGDISNVLVALPGDGGNLDIGIIAAGGTDSATNSSWNVSEDMLDKELTFKVTYTDANGGSQSFNSAALTIKKKAAETKATANASVDMDSIKKGDRPTFTFTLKNEGTTTLEDVSLKAPPLEKGGQIGKTFTLAPGETKKLTWKPNPGPTESIDVKPVFSYTVNGEKGTAKAGTVSVQVDGSAKPSASASTSPAADTLEVVATANNAKVKAGEKVTFTVTVRNQGETNLSGLKVTDAAGDQVKFTGTTLNAGSAAKGTIEVTPDKTTSYVFTMEAKDEDGNSVKATSDPVEITVDTVDIATALTMDVEFLPQISKPGPVDFNFIVKNSTGQEIKDIVISEATLGEVAKIDAMKDAKQDVTKQLQVDKTVSYDFKIMGTLADGTQVESKLTTPATVTVEQTAGGMTPMLIILLVVIIAIAAVGIVLGVYIYKNKKAGYTAFGKRRSASSAPKPNGGSRAQQPRREQRPPQVKQQQRPRQSLPREDIEPRPQQKQPTQQKSQPKTRQQRKGGGDRNRF